MRKGERAHQLLLLPIEVGRWRARLHKCTVWASIIYYGIWEAPVQSRAVGTLRITYNV